jgi:hypothetical protein
VPEQHRITEERQGAMKIASLPLSFFGPGGSGLKARRWGAYTYALARRRQARRSQETHRIIGTLPEHAWFRFQQMAMSNPSRYVELAEDCLQRAITAASSEVADEWLRIAGTWIAMQQFHTRIAAHHLPQSLPQNS